MITKFSPGWIYSIGYFFILLILFKNSKFFWQKPIFYCDSYEGEITSCGNTIRHQFDSFCKKVLKNEARNCYDEKHYRSKHERIFSELSKHEILQLSIMDEYFSYNPQIFFINASSLT